MRRKRGGRKEGKKKVHLGGKDEEGKNERGMEERKERKVGKDELRNEVK